MHKNTINKRDLQKHLEQLENLRTALFLKQRRYQEALKSDRQLLQKILKNLIKLNTTTTKETTEKEGMETSDNEKELILENMIIN